MTLLYKGNHHPNFFIMIFRITDGKRFISTFLYMIQVGISYLIMLAVMTYNVGLFVSIVAGYSVGYFFFKKDQSNSSLEGYQPI